MLNDWPVAKDENTSSLFCWFSKLIKCAVEFYVQRSSYDMEHAAVEEYKIIWITWSFLTFSQVMYTCVFLGLAPIQAQSSCPAMEPASATPSPLRRLRMLFSVLVDDVLEHLLRLQFHALFVMFHSTSECLRVDCLRCCRFVVKHRRGYK